jgi:hypothetical protein
MGSKAYECKSWNGEFLAWVLTYPVFGYVGLFDLRNFELFEFLRAPASQRTLR